MSTPNPELALDPRLSLDKEIAQRYVAFLVEHGRNDDPDARRDYCERAGVHKKLLHNNPHITAIEKLFRDQSSMERLGRG